MDNELYHHGVLGMKWGVRRYQNKDGSLTPAGKKRYGSLGNDPNNLRWVDKTAMRRSATRNIYLGTGQIGQNQMSVIDNYRKEALNLKSEKVFKKLDSDGMKLYKEAKDLKARNVSDDSKEGKDYLDRFEKWKNEYQQAQIANTRESYNLAKKYVKKMNDALVKDLDFKYIEKGSKYLTDNGLAWNAQYIYNNAWR